MLRLNILLALVIALGARVKANGCFGDLSKMIFCAYPDNHFSKRVDLSSEFEAINFWIANFFERKENVEDIILQARDHVALQSHEMDPTTIVAWHQLIDLSKVRCDESGLKTLLDCAANAGYDSKNEPKRYVELIVQHYADIHDEKCPKVYLDEYHQLVHGMGGIPSDLAQFGYGAASEPERTYFYELIDLLGKIKGKFSHKMMAAIMSRLFAKNHEGTGKEAHLKFIETVGGYCEGYIEAVEDLMSLVFEDIVTRRTASDRNRELQDALVATEFCKGFMSLNQRKLATKMV